MVVVSLACLSINPLVAVVLVEVPAPKICPFQCRCYISRIFWGKNALIAQPGPTAKKKHWRSAYVVPIVLPLMLVLLLPW